MQRLMTLFAMLVLVVMTGRAGTPQAASRKPKRAPSGLSRWSCPL